MGAKCTRPQTEPAPKHKRPPRRPPRPHSALSPSFVPDNLSHQLKAPLPLGSLEKQCLVPPGRPLAPLSFALAYLGFAMIAP